MKAQYLVVTAIPETELRRSHDQSTPVVLTCIQMQRISRNGWKCNRNHDPRVIVALQIDSLTPRKSYSSFRGIAKIGGKSEHVKGSILAKSEKGGIMLVE